MKELPTPTLPLIGMLDFRPMRAPRRHSTPAPLLPTPTPAAMPSLGYEVHWARHQDEVREAQQLRYQVFVEEMGPRPRPPVGTPAGLDVDVFDDFCEHLLVRAPAHGNTPGQVVGTYRVLTPGAARRAGSCYSDTEFDLTRLRSLRNRMAELGRSCVHPDHRSGAVILSLWGALAMFMENNGLDAVVGCASIGMRDGGHMAASLWSRLSQSHMVALEYQVRPRLPLPVDDLDQTLNIDPPPLIKGYLRCGAKVLGAPAWDPDFNTADLPMLLRMADLPVRYRRHFVMNGT